MLGAYTLGAAVFALIAGPLSDGWNRRSVLLCFGGYPPIGIFASGCLVLSLAVFLLGGLLGRANAMDSA
ncbi:hypothetical protein [Paenibacillus sp. HB172176]|uniref:hypothetical protein n=1 Tax=Paenibacillus sp. HB172176 TaxID=2493690 RepID=UPI00198000C0|nr:hypothetical protein [Paenibacillus sp. HB172176]